MKKRIVIIAEYFPPRLGGDRRIFEIMKRLSKFYNIHFITIPPSYVLFIRGIDSFSRARANQDNQIIYEEMVGHKVRLPNFIYPLWRKGLVLPYAVTMCFLIPKTIKKIIELKPDIIIVNNTSVYTGLVGFLLSKILRIKLLVEYNDLEALYTADLVMKGKQGVLNKFLKGIFIFIEDTIVKGGWKVTTHTRFIRRYAQARQITKPIRLIPDGVDTKIFHPDRFNGNEIRAKYKIGNGINLCLYAGRIEETAGADILLKTAKLLESRNNIIFMIVGEGDTDIVQKLTNYNNVILTGLISKEDIPIYISAADIVLVPFPDTLASHSISPLKLFEALAMGKPVVASAVSGIKEVIVDNFNGILVSSDPNEWAYAITQLIDEPEEMLLLGSRGRKTVCEKYDWSHLANIFMNVIEGDKA